jgi:WD40 repeat protein
MSLAARIKKILMYLGLVLLLLVIGVFVYFRWFYDYRLPEALSDPFSEMSDYPMVIEVSPDGRHIAYTSSCGALRLWDVETGRVILDRPRSEQWKNLRFIEDGRQLYTSQRDRVQLWDTASGKPVSATEIELGSGERLHMLTGKPVIFTVPQESEDESGPVFYLNQDGSRMITTGWRATVSVWETGSLKRLLGPIAHEDFPGIAISPDGTRILTVIKPVVRVWDVASGKLLTDAIRHEVIRNDGQEETGSALFSRDGRLVLTFAMDNLVRLWDAATGQPVGEPMVHKAMPKFAAFSPDESRLLTVTTDHGVTLWDARTSRFQTRLPHEATVLSARFSPDGHRVVTVALDARIRLWNAHSGTVIREFPWDHIKCGDSDHWFAVGARLLSNELLQVHK